MTDTKKDDNEKQADEALGAGDPDQEPSSSDTPADGVSTRKTVQRNELDGDYVVPVSGVSSQFSVLYQTSISIYMKLMQFVFLHLNFFGCGSC